ncbi:YtjB family periplasmic protein [Psychromonas sp.]|nr:YtjB family periplasmic protein [Psychromonas sp.]
MGRKRFWAFRILQILAIIILFSIITYQFISLQNESSAVRFQQTEKFSYALTNLAAAEASRYLSQKKHKDLQLLINDLTNDPIVRDATIYDQLGQIIYQSKTAIPLPVLLNLGNTNSKEADGVIPYIAELYNEKTKVGYIRITLEQQRILSLIQSYQERGLNILILLILLSFITGLIVMAVTFRKAEIAYKHIKEEIPNTIEQAKKDISQLTHRR